MKESRSKDPCECKIVFKRRNITKVCFSDESTFEILQNKAQFVHRRRGEKFHSDYVVQTVKHPTKIMIWSVISDKGTGRLYVVKVRLIIWPETVDEILRQHLCNGMHLD
ncbi:uncharacterized protein TNCV_2615061 [Trichonephila clavipes]|nr:uncharacterized protein TNCV_2615061 [Trichonephila clavipes]